MLKAPLSPASAELVLGILQQVLVDGSPLDRAYSRHFAGLKLSSDEQARITAVTGDLLRRLNLFCFLAQTETERLGREGSRLLNAWHRFYGLPFPRLKYSLPLDEANFSHRLAQAKQMPALWDGCPEWLDQLGQAELGQAWSAERAALTEAPKRFLRTNLIKSDRQRLADRLAQEGISTVPVVGVETALEVTSNGALFRTSAFADGWFEQQDAGSQMVAAALNVQPGMRVIDACAGAGGKTLYLAAAMAGRGRLLAMDVEQWKLDNLKERARRAGAHNVETRLITGSKTIKRLKLSADRLLLDVPCSGLGVLKRNPDAKWRDTETRLPVLMELQSYILGSYSRMLKVGGILVYATCSIMPCENRRQVDEFLSANDNFILLDDKSITPATSGFDGFYLARLQRIAE